MRFEPRLIREDGQVDTADRLDADLPDDLAMLAGQLADDAAFLAEQYPASPSTPRKIARTARWRAMGRRLVSPASGLVAAAVLVASITAGLTLAFRQGEVEPPANPMTRQTSAPQDARVAVTNGSLPDPSSIASHTSGHADLAGVDLVGVERREPSGGHFSGSVPSEQAQGMTGAELEGWIDLGNRVSKQPLSF